jgi:signal transduction histidine kinase
MAATVRAGPPPGNVRRNDPGSSLRWTRASARGAIRRPEPGATLAEMDSRTAPDPRPRGGLLLDAAIALAAFAGSIALLLVGETEGGGDGLDALEVLAVALASLPLIAWRRWPLAVFVVTALASSAVYSIAEPVGPPIGPTVAVYRMALSGDGSRARTQLTLGAVAIMLTIHVIAGGILGAEILFGILVWGGAWLAGDRSRLRRERMAELEERALRAEREAERERRLAAAEERGRIGRDLHDSAGHAINVILVHAGMGRLQTERDPERAREAFATIEEVARETVVEIDQMVRVLREDGSSPGEVEPPAGLAALDGLAERHRAAGLRVTTAYRGDRSQLPSAIDRAAYRILQEALTNAARHGTGEAEVEVAVENGALELSVENPVDPAYANGAEGGGHGLVGMRERAALLDGTLEAGQANGRFRVHARLPIRADAP